MVQQIVRPAGAAGETRAVALAAAVILACAGLAVAVQRGGAMDAVGDAHALDAGRDLTPAEQGLLADLRVAAEEIADLRDRSGRPAPPERLAAEGVPPFAADAAAARRGGHRWTLVERGGRIAYAGMGADPAVAGSLLLRLDGHGHAGGGDKPAVWLHRIGAAAVPDRLDDAALSAAGWRPVATAFAAGVTRSGGAR